MLSANTRLKQHLSINDYLYQRNHIKTRYESKVVVLEKDAENEEVAWVGERPRKGSRGETGQHVDL